MGAHGANYVKWNGKYVPEDRWEPTFKRIHAYAPWPYCYMDGPDDPLIGVLDPKKVEVLTKAFDYLDQLRPFREVADWVGEQTGDTITYQTLKNIWTKVRGHDSNNPRNRAMRERDKRRAPKTAAEKAELAARRKLQGAKIRLAHAEKKVAAFAPDSPETQYWNEVKGITPDIPPPEVDLSEKEVIFKPNDGPQTAFLAASEREVLYGGAAGGGKSYAVLADPVRFFENPRFKGLILRRTNDELQELKWKSRELYEKAVPGAKWRDKDSMWVFPSGAQLWMTYLDRDDDVMRYQGQAFTWIAFDELTQYPTPFPWNYMRSRLRSAKNPDGSDAGLPIYMRATSNPGGPGHGWVKRMFIDPAPPGRAFDATDIETGEVMLVPDGDPDFPPERWGKPLFKRRFIPARLSDNPYLSEGGEYKANLLSLPEQQRRQLLEGDWSVADGAAFSEFREPIHTCRPFEIPNSWRRFRSCDFGYSSHSAVHWFAIDPVYETLVVYRELYVSKMTGQDLARKIVQIEYDAKESIAYGVLDSSLWHVRGHFGPSIAEEMIQQGCKWRPSDRAPGSRIAGRNRLHELLQVDVNVPHYDEGKDCGRPGIIFFDTCRQIITDLPVIPTDPDGTDDIDKDYASDHAYDSVRYGIMSRPKASSPFDFGGISTFNYSGYRPVQPRFGH
jgi:hypothetical protein